ncbi:hypothetical protein [Roseateles sp. MS654]|uniref:hypothetical protein n=1 Tax=Roseateles sp. MS654 TaxID=3412685 RepID=UPI003C2EF265
MKGGGAALRAPSCHYASFFGWVLVFSLPPILLAWLAPFPVDHDREQDDAGPAGH